MPRGIAKEYFLKFCEFLLSFWMINSPCQMLLAATSLFVSAELLYIYYYYYRKLKMTKGLFISPHIHFIFGWLWNWKNWRACIIASFTSHSFTKWTCYNVQKKLFDMCLCRKMLITFDVMWWACSFVVGSGSKIMLLKIESMTVKWSLWYCNINYCSNKIVCLSVVFLSCVRTMWNILKETLMRFKIIVFSHYSVVYSDF